MDRFSRDADTGRTFIVIHIYTPLSTLAIAFSKSIINSLCKKNQLKFVIYEIKIGYGPVKNYCFTKKSMGIITKFIADLQHTLIIIRKRHFLA